jgi:hypothetical protein
MGPLFLPLLILVGLSDSKAHEYDCLRDEWSERSSHVVEYVTTSTTSLLLPIAAHDGPRTVTTAFVLCSLPNVPCAFEITDTIERLNVCKHPWP